MHRSVEIDAGQEGWGSPSLLAGLTVALTVRACGPEVARLIVLRMILEEAYWMAVLEKFDQGEPIGELIP